jgi:hypothetical protein
MYLVSSLMYSGYCACVTRRYFHIKEYVLFNFLILSLISRSGCYISEWKFFSSKVGDRWGFRSSGMLRGLGRQLDNVLEQRMCSKFRVQAVSKNNMEPIECLETSSTNCYHVL